MYTSSIGYFQSGFNQAKNVQGLFESINSINYQEIYTKYLYEIASFKSI